MQCNFWATLQRTNQFFHFLDPVHLLLLIHIHYHTFPIYGHQLKPTSATIEWIFLKVVLFEAHCFHKLRWSILLFSFLAIQCFAFASIG